MIRVKKMYHGTTFKNGLKIIESGEINAGCISEDVEYARGYAKDGFIFEVYYIVYDSLLETIGRNVSKLFNFKNDYLSELFCKLKFKIGDEYEYMGVAIHKPIYDFKVLEE